MTQDKAEHIIVGRISGIYGVQGWVKVFSYTEPKDNIFSYSPWLVRIDSDWHPMKMDASRKHGKGLVAHFESYDDRDEARRLVGKDIAVLRSQLPASAPGEFYWADLVGLRVVNQAGIELGIIDHLIETGSNDVLVVKAGTGTDIQEHLIPFVMESVIKHIDLDGGTLEVDWDTEA